MHVLSSLFSGYCRQKDGAHIILDLQDQLFILFFSTVIDPGQSWRNVAYSASFLDSGCRLNHCVFSLIIILSGHMTNKEALRAKIIIESVALSRSRQVAELEFMTRIRS